MCLSWLVLFHILAIHPYLQEHYVEPTYFPRERHRAVIGIVLYALAGLIGWAYSPKLALSIFLLLPIFYGITSEGLTETRIGLLHRVLAVIAVRCLSLAHCERCCSVSKCRRSGVSADVPTKAQLRRS